MNSPPQLARKQIFLLGSGTLADARLAAAAFAKELVASGAFTTVQWELDADVAQRFAIYLAHRAFLLSPRDGEALAAGATGQFQKRALRAAYTPTGLMQPLGLAEDPLGFMNDFLRATSFFPGSARVEDSMLVVERDAKTFVLVLTEIKGHPFASSTQERVMPASLVRGSPRAARRTLPSRSSARVPSSTPALPRFAPGTK